MDEHLRRSFWLKAGAGIIHFELSIENELTKFEKRFALNHPKSMIGVYNSTEFQSIENWTILGKGHKDSDDVAVHYYYHYIYTLPETNIAPENGWLEDHFPFGMAYFQGLC